MNPPDEKLDPILEEKFNAFRAVPARDAQEAGRGRAVFLAQAQFMAALAVSETQNGRHIGWIEKLNTLFHRKEGSPMFAMIVSLLTAVTLFFGGTGATVLAAQSSLPGQALYGLKMLSEDVRIDTAGSPQARLALDLEFAARRMKEMNTMFQKGQAPSEAFLTRYQIELDDALQLAAGVDDAQLTRAMDRLHTMLKSQEQDLLRLRDHSGQGLDAVMAQVQELQQTRLRLVEYGLQDPQEFRRQLRQGPSAGPSSSQTPGNSYGPGPDATETPVPGSGYGPGPGPGDCTQTPCSSYGPGPSGNPDQGYGPDPDETETRVPGSGYGPGPGPSQTQEPGAGYGTGSKTTQESGVGYGPGPSTTKEPGAGYGPGPNTTQEPDAGYGPGPDATQDTEHSYGPGPGPAPDSTCTPQAGQGAGSDNTGAGSSNGSNFPSDSGSGSGAGGGGKQGRP